MYDLGNGQSVALGRVHPIEQAGEETQAYRRLRCRQPLNLMLCRRSPSAEIAVAASGPRSGQAANFSRAPALIIAAPFSAIMIVGALVLVELTAGITEASMIRSASSP